MATVTILEHRQGRVAGCAVLGLAADIGFIGFNNRTGAAKGTGRPVHGFADAMPHEPCGLVGDAKHAVQLVGTHMVHSRDTWAQRRVDMELMICSGKERADQDHADGTSSQRNILYRGAENYAV